MTTIYVRRAAAEDIQTVADMWTRSSRRLAAAGHDQWQYPVKIHNIETAVAAGSCWIVTSPAGDLVGTVTVDDNADPNLWYPDDQPANALYLHRMITEPKYAGMEIGSALMDWAARQATGVGRSYIRLDAWRTNAGLRDYYLNRGFTLVRTVEDPTGTGICLQRPARIQLRQGPAVQEAHEADPTVGARPLN